MKYTIRAACASNVGKRRANNEDNFLLDNICMPEDNNGTSTPIVIERPIDGGIHFAVFDGIGGENYGEAASFAAVQKLKDCLSKSKPFYVSDSRYLEDIMRALNMAVLDKGRELVSERMGTTCADVYVGPRSVYIVNLGDSRVYLLRNGKLQQVSVDDVSDQPLPGRKKAPITQHLGMNPLEVRMVPHIKKTELNVGDRYLLCTDGLTDMVKDEEIEEILMAAGSSEIAVNMLIDKALENGGRDNVTVIVFEIC